MEDDDFKKVAIAPGRFWSDVDWSSYKFDVTKYTKVSALPWSNYDNILDEILTKDYDDQVEVDNPPNISPEEDSSMVNELKNLIEQRRNNNG